MTIVSKIFSNILTCSKENFPSMISVVVPVYESKLLAKFATNRVQRYAYMSVSVYTILFLDLRDTLVKRERDDILRT